VKAWTSALVLALAPVPGPASYPWLGAAPPAPGLASRIAPPAGFARAPVPADGFADWLRGLPLKPGRPAVQLFDGHEKRRQDVHHAVVDLDVGRRDLQQCADAVIRLRAEYLYSRGDYASIAFDFTSGDRVPYARWRTGERPSVQGRRVTWRQAASPDASHAGFRAYLDTVFTYAGSLSLRRELAGPGPEIEAGDVFVEGGSPGHAVLVVDVAQAPGGRAAFLLVQSYMPAQEVHVLRNPGRPDLDPWYPADFDDRLVTPEWVFRKDDRRRWKR
jgi:uncharacterized protein DUF4846